MVQVTRAHQARSPHSHPVCARACGSLVCRRVGDDARRQVIDRLLTQLESAARCCLMRDAALVKPKKREKKKVAVVVVVGGAVKDEQANKTTWLEGE